MATGNIQQQEQELLELEELIRQYKIKKDEDSMLAMPLVDHLEELRWRIFKCMIAIVVFSIVAFIFRDPIIHFLQEPLPLQANALADRTGNKLVVTGLMEGFTTYLMVSVVIGIVASLPVILYQLWAFVAPGLYAHEKRHAAPFILIGMVLFCAGVSLAYILIRFPVEWLVTFSSGSFTEIVTAGSYFQFVSFFMLMIGLVFELPLVLMFLALIGLITEETLKKKRSVIHVGMWFAATLLTPGADIWSPIFVGAIMSILYELSIVLIYLFITRKRAKEEVA